MTLVTVIAGFVVTFFFGGLLVLSARHLNRAVKYVYVFILAITFVFMMVLGISLTGDIVGSIVWAIIIVVSTRIAAIFIDNF